MSLPQRSFLSEPLSFRLPLFHFFLWQIQADNNLKKPVVLALGLRHPFVLGAVPRHRDEISLVDPQLRQARAKTLPVFPRYFIPIPLNFDRDSRNVIAK